MFRTLTIAALATILLVGAAAYADNDSDYVNVRTNKAPKFNPYAYDISHMTAEQRAMYDVQRQKQRIHDESFAATDSYGTAQFINQR